jgi:hypothetical protein
MSSVAPDNVKIRVCFSVGLLLLLLLLAATATTRDRNKAVRVRACRELRSPASTSPAVMPSTMTTCETVLHTAKQLLLNSSAATAPNVDPRHTSVPPSSSFITDKRASSSSACSSSVEGIPGLVTTVTIPNATASCPGIDCNFPLESITVVILTAAAAVVRLLVLSSIRHNCRSSGVVCRMRPTTIIFDSVRGMSVRCCRVAIFVCLISCRLRFQVPTS